MAGINGCWSTTDRWWYGRCCNCRAVGTLGCGRRLYSHELPYGFHSLQDSGGAGLCVSNGWVLVLGFVGVVLLNLGSGLWASPLGAVILLISPLFVGLLAPPGVIISNFRRV